MSFSDILSTQTDKNVTLDEKRVLFYTSEFL